MATPPAPRPPMRRVPSASADESPSALYKLEPIHQARASTVILGAPQRNPRLAGGIASASASATGYGGPQRGRRPSQDEIRALLQRTTAALDRIVQIRESMEPFVDFAQFDKPPTGRRGRRPSSAASLTASASVPSGSSTSSARTTPASSYGSTASSSSLTSDDPLAGDRDADHDADGDHSSARSLPTLLHQSSSLVDSDVPVNRSTTSTTRTLSKQGEDEDEDEDEEEEDDDDDLGDVPPLKEARLERLRHIDVQFVEGLPREFFQALARFLLSVLEVKTRHSRFNFFKEAFTGADAVRELVLNGFCDDPAAALRLGGALVRLQLVEHVSRVDDQLLNSKDNFYRFTRLVDASAGSAGASAADAALEFARDTAARSRRASSAAAYRESVLAARESAAVGELVEYDFSEASDEVHALVTDEALLVLARVLLKVFERKNKLLFYKGFVGCFLGAEAVNVLREMRIATSLIDAVLVGQALLDEGLIEPIASAVSAGVFQDKYVFYRLTAAAAALADMPAGQPLPVPRPSSARSMASSVSSGSGVSSGRGMTP